MCSKKSGYQIETVPSGAKRVRKASKLMFPDVVTLITNCNAESATSKRFQSRFTAYVSAKPNPLVS